ncbi:MAG: hypothetical protein ABJF10_17910 [Chthoniobacter sp.]|uniref:hypothetical protein n=1 Tax=Chthoniobacter sp. TaxID=2510640 RepID=UPI0032A7048B
MSFWRTLLMASCVFWLTDVSTFATRIPPPDFVPLDQLLQHAENYAAKHPEKPESYYVLGRIHHLAFKRGAGPFPVPSLLVNPSGEDTIVVPNDNPPAREDGGDDMEVADRYASKVLGLPKLIPQARWQKIKDRWFRIRDDYFDQLRNDRISKVTGLDWQVRLKHAEEAEKNYKEAMRLDPEGSLYLFSLASFEEDFDLTVSATPGAKLPAGKQRWSARKIRDLFRQAFILASPPGGDWTKYAEERISAGHRLEATTFWTKHGMAYREAGRAYVRMASRRSARLSKNEKEFLATVRRGLNLRWEFDQKG